MDKNKKYELIVKIKELLIETDIKDTQELLDTRKISLNASKVLSLIYSDDTKILPNLFENKVNKYKELKKEENKYIETLLLREKQLKEFEKYVNFDIRLNYHNHIPKYQIPVKELSNKELKAIYDSLEVDVIKLEKKKDIYSFYYVFDEFTIDVYDEKKHNFYQHILDVLSLNHIKGIFDFIDFVFSNQEEQFFSNNNSDASYDEELSELFTEFDKDEYRRYIASFYDYYYLYNSEKNIQKWSFIKDNNLFSYIAYKYILSNLLEYLYTVDLTGEEKQEIEKEKKINIYLKRLTPKERTLFIDIVNNIKMTVPDMAEKYSNSIRTIENQIDSLTNKLIKKKGIENLRKFIENQIF